MAAPVAELRTELSASVARFQQDFKKSQKVVRSTTKGMGNSFKGMSKSSTGLANSIFSLKGGLAILAGTVLTKSISKFLTFEKGLREVGTLMGGLTDKQMKDMGDELKNISSETGQALDKLVKARYDIVSAGFTDAADSAKLLRVSADLAVAGVSDVATTADLLTTAVNAYGLEAEDAAEISDKMFTIVRLGKTTIDQMAGSMGKVLAVGAPMGVSLDEVGAALAVLTANGQSTEEALTAIRAAIVELSKPGKELADALKSIGVESGEALLKEEGLKGALDAVSKAALANDTTIVQLLGNIRSMQAVLPLATTGAKDFAVALDDIADSTGATSDGLDEIAKSAAFEIDKFKANINVIFTSLGGPFSKLLADTARRFNIIWDAANPPPDIAPAIDLIDKQIRKFTGDLAEGTITAAQYSTAVAFVRQRLDEAAAAEEGAALANDVLKLSFGESKDAAKEVTDVILTNTDAMDDAENEANNLAAAELRLANAALVNAHNTEVAEKKLQDMELAIMAAKNAMFAYAGFLTGGAADSFRKFMKIANALIATLIALKALQIATGTSPGKGKALAKLFGFANGGVFSGGRVTPFGGGGIVNGPTLFPMADGAGLMGEAGAEAIMPLTRIGGKLGVEATGGGSSQTFNEFHFNGPTNREFIENEVIPMIEEKTRTNDTILSSLRDFDQTDDGLALKRSPS